MASYLSKTYGTRGVLSITFKGYETAPKVVRGVVQVGSGDSADYYPMTEGESTGEVCRLLVPADLPEGLHLMEVQANGRTILYKHLEVKPGPVGAAGQQGQVDWEAEVTESPLESIVINQNPGPPGERGPQGEPGRDGVAPTAEEVAEKLAPMISTEISLEGPAATNNWHASFFEIGATYIQGGMLLTQFGYRCRFDSMNECTTEPVYLGVWEQSADGASWVRLGASIDTQVQAINTDVLWRFEPGEIKLSGRPLRFCLLIARTDEWRTDLTMGMRVSATSDTQTLINYNGSTWRYVPKYFFLGLKLPGAIDMSGGGVGRREFTIKNPKDNQLEIAISSYGAISFIVTQGRKYAKLKAIRGYIEARVGKRFCFDVKGRKSSYDSCYDENARGKTGEWVFDPPVEIQWFDQELNRSQFTLFADDEEGKMLDYIGLYYDPSANQKEAPIIALASTSGIGSYALCAVELVFEWDAESALLAEMDNRTSQYLSLSNRVKELENQVRDLTNAP